MMRLRALLALFCLFALTTESAGSTSPRSAFHLMMITQVYAGSVAAPDVQFVELQMWAAGQNFVFGHQIVIYDRSGVQIGAFTLNANPPNGSSQATILLATPAAEIFFGRQADFDFMTPILPRAGGKVCFDAEPFPIDCVAWGGYVGPATNVGTPFNSPVGLLMGSALARRLDLSGDPGILDFGDDTNNSANDFRVAVPIFRPNSGPAGFAPPSSCGNSIVESLEDCDDGDTAGGDGCSALCEFEPAVTVAETVAVDPAAGASSNGNGVFEIGETVPFEIAWRNNGDHPLPLAGAMSTFGGSAGPVYAIPDGAASFGTIGAGAVSNCTSTANCYRLALAGTRPAMHFDAAAAEVLSNGGLKNWSLHVGGSFGDVAVAHPFYRFIETILHKGITGGCAVGSYCPENAVTRSQMAVFLLRASLGGAYTPPPATGTVFDDVPVSHPFAAWIEELADRGITGGCASSPPRYCPEAPVTRMQMAVFLLRTKFGSAHVPPAATGVFEDVPVTHPFAPFVEQLFSLGITGGCADTPPMYCPHDPNTRGQMAVFLTRTFDLKLYGP